MSAYAMAYLHDVDLGAEIVEYLQRIDATLEPFGGHFLVHGASPDLLEGDDPGLPIVIEFPTLGQARGWYDSPAYREILPLRTRNTRSTTFLIDGVDADHKATDVLVA